MESFTIRNFISEDCHLLYPILADHKVMKYIEEPFSLEETIEFIENNGLCDPPRIFAVESDDAFIGYVIYHDYDETAKEIGWVLRSDMWDKGYAQILTEKLISMCKDEDKDAVIECVPEQHKTVHIAKKYGFEHEGQRGVCNVYRLKTKSL
ncbi:MAG: GNAT family N-acetyltransferase [Erysipelotrichaceae bacterium]|nr:GNAT family N-acetyltransferase [Erysipelotrichaceae bacterium]